MKTNKPHVVLPLRQDTNGFTTLAVLLIVFLVLVIMTVGILHSKSGVHLKISNGCRDTNIAVQPVALNSLDSPLNLQAKITMGNEPVRNERVAFRMVGRDNHSHDLSDLLGYATTDTNGVAVLHRPAGVKDLSITFGKGGILTAYRAEFDGNSVSDRVKDKTIPFYCGSNAEAKFQNALTIQSVSI